MTPYLLTLLCEPVTKADLVLENATYDAADNIVSGDLIAAGSGKRYPIVNGIPRFVDFVSTDSVASFGDEWNHFNFVDFKSNWLDLTVANTFGSPAAFKGKVIVDAGGGSGSQTKWFAEYGAKHVIMLDLSHSVDDVVQRNLAGLKNVDVIQCSIDAPPLKDRCIDGVVYCHNVIQHTPSVEKTAAALYEITAPGGEFVFNCYQLNDQGPVRWARWHLVYRPTRFVLSRMPFAVILWYARTAAALRMIPGLGALLEKSLLVGRGELPTIQGETRLLRLKRSYKQTVLNTFDAYGSHSFQHHKSNEEIQKLVHHLQPDEAKVLNTELYYLRPPPAGCALRVLR